MDRLPCEIEYHIHCDSKELSMENFVIRNVDNNKCIVKLSRNLQHDPHTWIHLEISNKSLIFRSITFLKWFICDELIHLQSQSLHLEYGYYQGTHEILGNFHTCQPNDSYSFLIDIISTYAEHMITHNSL